MRNLLRDTGLIKFKPTGSRVIPIPDLGEKIKYLPT
jgi:hypothetical protein